MWSMPDSASLALAATVRVPEAVGLNQTTPSRGNEPVPAVRLSDGAAGAVVSIWTSCVGVDAESGRRGGETGAVGCGDLLAAGLGGVGGVAVGAAGVCPAVAEARVV